MQFAVIANVYRCVRCKSAARLVADATKGGVKRPRCSSKSCPNS
jgi:DNA-directed RNA polymerase subunit RPC12/RpoP